MSPELQKVLTEYKWKLELVLSKIRKIGGGTQYTELLAKSFHLGTVGGSGRKIHSLNRRRERDIEKTVSNAIKLSPLYKERDRLEKFIENIESGEYEISIQQKIERKKSENERLFEYWNNLKAGDKVDVGGNSPAIVVKKNKKSIVTDGNCTWTVAEIIGKEASKLIK